MEMVYSADCYHDSPAQRLRFVINLRKIDTQSKLMVADPFTLIDYNKTTGELCKLKYTGPKYVIYTQEKQCATPVHSYQSAETDTMVVVPEHSQCTVPIGNSSLMNWQDHNCEIRHIIQDSEIIQIKPVDTLNLIYCPGLTIEAYNRLMSCPEFPFQLSAQEKFTVGKFKYETDRSAIKTNLKFIPDASEKINFQLMPDLHEFDPDEVMDSLKERYIQLKGQLRAINLSDLYTPFIGLTTISVIIIILMIGLTAFYCRKRRNRRVIMKSTPTVVEEIPLQSTDKHDVGTITGEKPQKGTSQKFFLLSVLLCLPLPGLSLKLNGTDTNVIVIKYGDPCASLERHDSEYRCKRLLDETFISPLETICTLKPELSLLSKDSFPSLTRRRRSELDELKLSALQTKFIIIKEKIKRFLIAWSMGEISYGFLVEAGLEVLVKNDTNMFKSKLRPLFCMIDRNCRSITVGYMETIDHTPIIWLLFTIMSILGLTLIIIVHRHVSPKKDQKILENKSVSSSRALYAKPRFPRWDFPPPPCISIQ